MLMDVPLKFGIAFAKAVHQYTISVHDSLERALSDKPGRNYYMNII